MDPMARLRKSVAWLCIGLVVLAAVTSPATGQLAATLALLWLLCAALAVRSGPPVAVPRDARHASLLALVPSRAPPPLFASV